MLNLAKQRKRYFVSREDMKGKKKGTNCTLHSDAPIMVDYSVLPEKVSPPPFSIRLVLAMKKETLKM